MSPGELQHLLRPVKQVQTECRDTDANGERADDDSNGRVAGGISAPGFHRSVRDSLPSYGSCCPDHLVAGFAQAQCAKYRGWDAAAFLMEWIAFFHVLSFLYLFMIHRSR